MKKQLITICVMQPELFIELNLYSTKCMLEKNNLKINNLSFRLIKLHERIKYKVYRCQEIINIRTEINKIENKESNKINKTKSWFFENNNIIDKSLKRLTKKKRIHKLLT